MLVNLVQLNVKNVQAQVIAANVIQIILGYQIKRNAYIVSVLLVNILVPLLEVVQLVLKDVPLVIMLIVAVAIMVTI